MKLFIALLGVVCIVFAAAEVGYTVTDGLFEDYFYFGTVKQAWARHFPSGMHLTRVFLDANMPGFTGQSLTWVGKQTAAMFFGATGAIMIILTRFSQKN